VDLLSQVLSRLHLEEYVSGSFVVGTKQGFRFPTHKGIKCYAVASGSCWLQIHGDPSPVHLHTGDCILLPRGLRFCLRTDLAHSTVDFPCISPGHPVASKLDLAAHGCSIIGGHFILAGGHSELLLGSLPPVVHLSGVANHTPLRLSFERMIEELCDPQPGGYLIAQQAAHTMLIQALRVHLRSEAGNGTGWLFALTDPQISIAIRAMHDHPERRWTLRELAASAGMSRTVFAQRFRHRVGTTAMEYLTRWRLIVAGDRLKTSDETVLAIAASSGYKTESAFGRAFRRLWGCSPREHRSDLRASSGGLPNRRS
jgi:AraC-like DNA-binding protein